MNNMTTERMKEIIRNLLIKDIFARCGRDRDEDVNSVLLDAFGITQDEFNAIMGGESIAKSENNTSDPKLAQHITRCLTISTAHISDDTISALESEPYENNMALSVYAKEGYGFWIFLPDDLKETGIPEDLWRCLLLARKNGCEWLCLDCDGAEIYGLTTYPV